MRRYGILSVAMIIICFLSFVYGDNSNSDFFNYDRPYTLIEKNQGGHEYKGRSYGDYFFTVKYDDDKGTLWTKEVSGTKFFSQQVNGRYIERARKSFFGMYVLFLSIGLIIGIILFAISIGEEM